MQYRLLKKLVKMSRFSLKADGTSMLPIIRPGDVLHLKKSRFDKVKEDELIMVEKKRQFMIHRVIYKSTKYLITKGDHNFKSDGHIPSQNVHARLTYFTRKGQSLRVKDYYLIQADSYLKELAKITQAFNRKKVDYVFLKGLPLYLFLQKNLPQRLYADCDLLISPKDYQTASVALQKRGFQSVDSSYSPIFKLFKKVPTETVFIKKTSLWPVVLDIHREPAFLMNQISGLDALYPQKQINKLTELFLARKSIFKYKNIKFNLLSAEHQILYLALHFFHHSFSGYFRLALMRSACRKLKGDWQGLLKQILEYRLENFVYPSFLLLEKYYPFSIPVGFLNKIKPLGNKLRLIKKLTSGNLLESEAGQISAGRKRFSNIFYLSPEPLPKKLRVIFYPSVINSIIYIPYKLTVNFARRTYRKIFFFIKS
ncbi:hypothetical protein A3J20_00360 [Candidatus Gottesmanbacteria bacterium RIFCSPLOWO2_02_FULL_42_29]|uniref:Peptidase S24/S26A/S26B/S26C domain-containing protein n=2 Tax=Candidatus Gottesmaniibacteriota TaxID=1752720 RepID=A0A1F6BB48_9BACT|nr:MAG: Peptidase S24/S26A/S26B, conserved region [Candidatus Gottesmanbacteria bacterium GW2011_GWA2_42_18]KKS74968.1 MAG: Peptidase S24/S26A/S26B, conserved region [Candidatus Gottesmanbacteria bacterium GW2011_GWC2_42_8]OGG10777.1 MAG: hypothetical protein A2781_03905 [Candidatus Gottesmanbacteria bacterium RIFCSPHIGHO2_01_FULL_42_27]OGG21940.1 MAG: hypothetical protein A3E72_01840 [Candidatus Gottesmanbacteria bacterium RIFCSPHIGHO2_12_FULL_43_26]OGG34061.1 MAG: hypothetical protein A3G68_0